MRKGYSKRIKKLLREYMIEAYEKELNIELKKLEKSFAEWQKGEISNGELSARIHDYDRGPSRDLFMKYNYGENAVNVAYAIVAGMIDREKVPRDLLEAIEGHIHFYQEMKDRDELRLPGEE